MPDESNCFMLSSFLPRIKADTVHPTNHNNIYKLCPRRFHARRTNMLDINFLTLSKAEI